ncbi:hypothetical protein EIN_274300 [Entamoeba invadens IP1]|uniref:Leucine rich repeat containing protein BspA family protein n=1 Tax=Entamoeba invadens IP1 TaxID=370355 RepID=A0A0A1U4P6_ENTIV|nr:hypothetical protein EIN_274300 [Entamoeba invadens IP1]ELP87863.1 hypothetical protein EIN_274300 [Entamoeba invadens IP1]|eukprot:XP_004254634.1 hypothetical protein EIN_274300 [Entamoeba invadens IP1]
MWSCGLSKHFLSLLVPYLSSTQDAEEFTMINKKCKDAVEALQQNPCYSTPSYFTEAEKQMCFTKEIRLFPRLISVAFNTFSPFVLSYNPQRIDNIYIFDEIDVVNAHLLLPIAEKLVKISIFAYQEAYDLSLFTSLKYVTIRLCARGGELSQFFTDKSRHFETVKIIFEKGIDVAFLQNIEFYNFHTIIFLFKDITLLNCAQQIIGENIHTKRIIFCYKEYTELLNKDVYIIGNKWILSTTEINELAQNSNVLDSEQIFNFRNLENTDFLQLWYHKCDLPEIVKKVKQYLPYKISNVSGNISFLNNFINIKGVYPLILPENVEVLKIELKSVPNDNISQNFCDCQNLKKLKINCQFSNETNTFFFLIPRRVIHFEMCGGSVTAKNMTCVEKMVLRGVHFIANLNFDKLHVLEIKDCTCDGLDSLTHLNTLKSVHSIHQTLPPLLKKLLSEPIHFTPLHTLQSYTLLSTPKTQFEMSMKHFTHLKELQLNYVVNCPFSLPNTLTRLSLNICHWTELVDFTSLIFLVEFSANCYHTKCLLPCSVRKVVVSGCLDFTINNLKDLSNLKTLIISLSKFDIHNTPQTVEHLFIDNQSVLERGVLDKFGSLKNIENFD